jgi:SOS response regulatory protein OraA/RecX
MTNGSQAPGRRRSRDGATDAWIRHDLAGHGVAAEVVAEAIGALVPEAERAAALVERLGSTPKTGARLARKGFGRDSLEAALGIDVAG